MTISIHLKSQDGVGINTNSPHPSALLDISSTNQGVLVPRMTSAERDLIVNPAQGLLIYNTSSNSFWYYDSSVWEEILSINEANTIRDLNADTRIEVEQNTDEDIIRFTLDGTEQYTMNGGRLNVHNTGNSVFFGANAGLRDELSDNENVFIGDLAGRTNNTGSNNIGLGYLALDRNTTGSNNMGIGAISLRLNTIGSHNLAMGTVALLNNVVSDSNLALGYRAMRNHRTGNNNTTMGLFALRSNTTGSNNVVVGSEAMELHTNGSNNTILGRRAGENSRGSGNIYIGHFAGQNATGNNELFIDNSNSNEPLIYGDFENDLVVIHGDLDVQNNITYVGDIADISDKRLKENFDTLNQVMQLVNKLNAYSYSMKNDKIKQREYGLMAQEVQKVFPEAVSIIDEEKGYMGVNYVQLIAILTAGLNEQQQLITTLGNDQRISNSELDRLKAEVEEIRSLLKE